jgi:pimeloyl-ACP methyl ester carboxylesterase
MAARADRWWRAIALVVAAVAAATVGAVLAARAGWLTPSDEVLRQRYALPGSRFFEFEGQPIHYVDEGEGAAVVLVHGSFGSLRMWEAWAAALRGRHRVIRFDRPPMGLSGAAPGGDYGATREMRIIDALTTELGVSRFVLVGTSSAGVAAAGYAAAHPQRVRGLVLSNVAVGAFDTHPERLPAWLRLVLWVDLWFGGWHPNELWRQVLRRNFHDPGKVTASLVEEWTALNNRAQRMPPTGSAESQVEAFARTPRDLPRIRAPTLLLWSAHDHELPVESVGQRALQLLGSPDKSLQIVPGCGHLMPLECGPESAALAVAWLARLP